ncbi:DUF4190 domain-containing protein [Streptomyces liangshanensis]|uniref:DUF4190 domain-containing protein n=2 Tax=Streptomyces liangshanensis TaxID=2717324 RepID=A0A6G9H8U5_9ACTN|nr:DUF4190 domain-containing protein [Streptomyces liangshanensis]
MPAPPEDQNPGEQGATVQDPWRPGPPAPAPAPPPGPAASDWPVYPGPVPGPMPQPRNGMGVTALVLGIAGVVLSLLIILFWMSWLPSLLAVIFGSLGLSHARKGLATNRAMALTGVILGAVGLLISVGGGVVAVVTVKKVTEDARARIDEVKAAEAAEDRKAREEEKARHLSFGETYTYENGLKVTVAEPQPFTPDDYVFGHAKGNEAVQVTVTVVNSGKERISVETGLPNVNDADGASTELVIDGSGRQKVITGYVLPGRKSVGKYAFSLPPDAADRIEVEFSPDAKVWPDAYWSGPN